MIRLFDWYRTWRGERKFMPNSERQGQEWAQTRLIPLQAQIAVFFGQPSGTLEDLQNGVMKLHQGEPIICSDCQRDIFKDRHKTDCEIVRQYKEVTTKPATPKYVPTKKEKKYRLRPGFNPPEDDDEESEQ